MLLPRGVELFVLPSSSFLETFGFTHGWLCHNDHADLLTASRQRVTSFVSGICRAAAQVSYQCQCSVTPGCNHLLDIGMAVGLVQEGSSSSPSQLNHSLISTLFEGQLGSRMCCSHCQYTRTVLEPFLDLSLPIPGAVPSAAALRSDSSSGKRCGHSTTVSNLPVRDLQQLHRTGEYGAGLQAAGVVAQKWDFFACAVYCTRMQISRCMSAADQPARQV